MEGLVYWELDDPAAISAWFLRHAAPPYWAATWRPPWLSAVLVRALFAVPHMLVLPRFLGTGVAAEPRLGPQVVER